MERDIYFAVSKNGHFVLNVIIEALHLLIYPSLLNALVLYFTITDYILQDKLNIYKAK